MTKVVTLLVALMLIPATGAFATAFTINNTGLGADGAADPFWSMIAPSAAAAYKVTGSPSAYPFTAWADNTATSGWIAPRASYPTSAVQDAAGTWVFGTTFTLTELLVASTASISGQMWSDNTVANVFLNGNPLGITTGPVDPLTTATAFSLNSGFVSGANVLSFYVNNLAIPGGGAGPVGLRVEFGPGFAEEIPEPGTLGLIGLGLLGLAALRRRGKTS